MKNVIFFTIALFTTFEALPSQAIKPSQTQAAEKAKNENLEKYEYEISIEESVTALTQVARLTHMKSREWVQQTTTFPKPFNPTCTFTSKSDTSSDAREAFLWRSFAACKQAELNAGVCNSQQIINKMTTTPPASPLSLYKISHGVPYKKVISWAALPPRDKNLHIAGIENPAKAVSTAASSPAKPVHSDEPDHVDPAQPGTQYKAKSN